MSSFKYTLEAVTAPGSNQIPGAVVIAADRSGDIIDLQAVGVTSVDPINRRPMTEDTTFWIASCTKLITTVAALQCVERGQLALDEDVSTILHELNSPDVLVGFDAQSGEPTLRKSQERITLRQLLTHSSGNMNDLLSPEIKKWRPWQKPALNDDDGEIVKRFLTPLLFEPGHGWVYGGGLDWAGRMVERVNGGIRLGDYFKKHIFEPLGMRSTGFRPSENESIRESLSATTVRTPTGELVGATPFPPANPKDDLGGGGLYTAPKDYIKVLIALLQNKGTLLKPETVDMMFAPQLPDSKYLEAVVNPERGVMYRSGVDSRQWNFGLGGILNMEDVEGVCKKGTMTWGGLPNLFWWIDRTAGTCGMYASQLLPPSDATSMQIALEFRKSIARRS
ncbi:beta-lactamase [Exophiala aquamarina CBS 119918]|uniref:Beta-lactamase n=1 Tax=Exophiala aquamarina CBS 119918 TaxID=1182545 RepID=A0A072PA84_9EURO|nr:beta-lactamase [Exophiala aquamarina CBS 119918]KEF56667.1 beta-lactamase [Exophiala aquamarina CBS 119918]